MIATASTASRSRHVRALGVLALSTAIVAALGWAAGRQNIEVSPVTGASHGAPGGVVSKNAPSNPDNGYPPPAPPSPTPEPEHGLYPPPAVEHEIVGRESSPYGGLIATLELALSGAEGGAFSPWVDDLGMGVALDYPGATEGLGVRLAPTEASELVDRLFASGADPVVQGYFEEAGCDHNLGETPPCAAVVILTGLGGPVPMPTRHPAESLGPAVPADVPLAAAAWSIYPDATGPYWTDWWLGDGYYQLVEKLVAEGHGTYFVLR